MELVVETRRVEEGPKVEACGTLDQAQQHYREETRDYRLDCKTPVN